LGSFVERLVHTTQLEQFIHDEDDEGEVIGAGAGTVLINTANNKKIIKIRN
jgi:hypothetical protein